MSYLPVNYKAEIILKSLGFQSANRGWVLPRKHQTGKPTLLHPPYPLNHPRSVEDNCNTYMKKERNNFEKAFVGLKNPDLMFDLCIWGAFTAGNLDGKMPIDETRKVFEKIKKLLKN